MKIEDLEVRLVIVDIEENEVCEVIKIDNEIEKVYLKGFCFETWSDRFSEGFSSIEKNYRAATHEESYEFIAKKRANEQGLPPHEYEFREGEGDKVYDANNSHYKHKGFEPIDVINEYDLNFNLGNVIKYVLRAPYKGSEKQDLEKALAYINYELARISK